jgi:hypothetical protein
MGGGFFEVLANVFNDANGSRLNRAFEGLDQFNATLGRNNQDEEDYLRRMRRGGGKYKISYANKSKAPAGTLMHSSSFEVFSNKNEIIQTRDR